MGSLKFPSYPFEYMPWSTTTVVSIPLVMTRNELLPSVLIRTSAFPLYPVGVRVYPLTTKSIFEAQYRACILDHVRLRTPVAGFTLGLFFRSADYALIRWDLHPLGNKNKFLGVSLLPSRCFGFNLTQY